MGDDAIQFVGERPGQVMRHTGDSSRIKEALGWEPQVSWEEGLRQTIDWHRKNQQLWQKQVWMRSIPITLANGRIEYH